MKIINIFGGPGTGKSVTAARLFAELKIKGVNCELITEYAKELVYDESFKLMENQILIFAKQHHKMYRLKDKVDFMITDAPLFNSIVYSGKGEENKPFHTFVMHEFNKYNNLNIYLERETEYQQGGRYQDEAGARKIDDEVLNLFKYFKVPYVKIGLDNVLGSITNLL